MAELRWIHLVPTADIVRDYKPGSRPASDDWTWDDEERDIMQRTCCCRSHECANPMEVPEGHYQRMLEASIREHGISTTTGIVLGTDGRVWDGNHRVVAARRLGIEFLPVEND